MKHEVGHKFLAKLGKTRLRPGGITATNWLMSHAKFTSNSEVLEVACNMGTTLIEIAKEYNCQVTGIDMDGHALSEAKKNVANAGVTSNVTLVRGNALNLPFEDNSFDIVINEAMLTMQSQKAKDIALSEYYCVLKPEGILLTHDITTNNFSKSDQIHLNELLNMATHPLPIDNWKACVQKAGFTNIIIRTGNMSLMNPTGLIRDEGLLGSIRIIKNGLKKGNRDHFKKMFNFFHKNRKKMNFIAIRAQKIHNSNY